MYCVSVLFLSLLVPTLASLTPISTTQSTLLSFGTAHTTQTYILSTSSDAITSITVDAPTKTPNKILSRYETTHVQVENGVYNITVDFFFESWVGNFDYAIVINTLDAGIENTYTHVDSHSVYGIIFYHASQIVSGDEHQGVRFSQYLSPGSEGQTLNAVTHAPEGVDMTPTLSTRDRFSQNSELLPKGAITLANGHLSIRAADFTTGAAVIDVLCAGLEMDGEVFETVIEVSVSDKPRAPVVLLRANGTVMNGEARVDAVLKNGGHGVVLLLNGTELHGESINGKYVFVGSAKPGIYENVGIRNGDGDGVVQAKLVLEILEGDVGDKKRTAGVAKGKKSMVVIIVITATVVAVVVALVAIALYMYLRSKKMNETFIDGRVEHIARDVYGRGSVHV